MEEKGHARNFKEAQHTHSRKHNTLKEKGKAQQLGGGEV